MESWSITFVVLMAILFHQTQSTDTFYDQLSIDCGAIANHPMPGYWVSDDDFIKTGEKSSVFSTTAPEEMNTLRFFPNGNKNCYNLPLKSPNKSLLRAGFYYGNYDRLSKPPVFDLQINGQYWTTIYIGLIEEVQYVELIYQTKSGSKKIYPTETGTLELCLVRVGDFVPFISSIEARILPDDFYRLMPNDTILHLQSRIHFGLQGGSGAPSEITPDEYYRNWKVKEMPDNYENVSTFSILYGTSIHTENQPPNLVLESAITPKFDSDPIEIFIGTPVQTSPAYFVLYFKEVDWWNHSNSTRNIEIYINGYLMEVTQVPQSDTSQVVSLYLVAADGPANVTLAQARGSDLPPILNAMEVFTISMEASNGGHSHYSSSLLLAVFYVVLMLV